MQANSIAETASVVAGSFGRPLGVIPFRSEHNIGNWAIVDSDVAVAMDGLTVRLECRKGVEPVCHGCGIPMKDLEYAVA